MQSRANLPQSLQAINCLFSDVLSEFSIYLEHAGYSGISSIKRALAAARHFLAWLELTGTNLESIDDGVLLAFRDHDCHCFAWKKGVVGQKQNSGLLRTTMTRVIRFVRFLEDSGRTAHPNEAKLGNRVLEDFLEECERQGFRSRTLYDYRRIVRHFLIWIHRRRITIKDVTANVVDDFLSHDCLCLNYVNAPDKHPTDASYIRVVRKFEKFLVQQGLVPNVSTVTTPRPEGQLDAFCSWLKQHRGVCPGTARTHVRVLSSLLVDLGTEPNVYDAALIRQVLLKRFAKVSETQAKRLATCMRMYLRFLSSTGSCLPNLVSAVMIPRSYRLATLPRYISMQDVEQVIASCDTDTAVGIRDRAILLLLARLGLRGGDVCDLRFADIDWNKAQIHVSGKSKCPAALPLPQDVGDALLQYTLTVRPHVDTSRVFLRLMAPHRPFRSSAAISRIVSRALTRAGVESPSGRGAHLLRHSVATGMLRIGAPMEVIGALLRHQSPETTRIYAKTDIPMLQEVAQPWLGDAQ